MSVCLLFLLFGVVALPVAGATHQICLPLVPGQPVPAPAQPGTLLINEVVWISTLSWLCPGATSSQTANDTSWVEIYNPQNQPFDLYTAHAFIDNGPAPSTVPQYFPLGSTIAPHGFFTFFMNSATFANNAVPYSLRLLISDIVVDQITLPVTVGNNQSYARVSDGAPTWHISDTPTIGSSNVLPTPTPVPTVTPTHTPLVHHSTKVKTSNQKVHGTKSPSLHVSATINRGGDPSVGASGVQPAWSGLQLPDPSPHASSSSASVHPVSTTTSSSTVGNDSANIQHEMLFTTLVVMFTCGLYWWCRRFKRSGYKKQSVSDSSGVVP